MKDNATIFNEISQVTWMQQDRCMHLCNAIIHNHPCNLVYKFEVNVTHSYVILNDYMTLKVIIK